MYIYVVDDGRRNYTTIDGWFILHAIICVVPSTCMHHHSYIIMTTEIVVVKRTLLLEQEGYTHTHNTWEESGFLPSIFCHEKLGQSRRFKAYTKQHNPHIHANLSTSSILSSTIFQWRKSRLTGTFFQILIHTMYVLTTLNYYIRKKKSTSKISGLNLFSKDVQHYKHTRNQVVRCKCVPRCQQRPNAYSQVHLL